jgi:hypothetical protein
MDALHEQGLRSRSELGALGERMKQNAHEASELRKAIDDLYPRKGDAPWDAVEGRLVESTAKLSETRAKAFDDALESLTAKKIGVAGGLLSVMGGGNPAAALASAVKYAAGAAIVRSIAKRWIRPLIESGSLVKGTELIVGKVSRAGQRAATAGQRVGLVLSTDQIKQVGDELDATPPEHVEGQMRAQLEGRAPPDQIDDAVRRNTEAMALLKEKWPRPPVEDLFGGAAWKPSATQVATAQRYLRATSNPESVLDDFAKGHGTPEGVETLERVHPELLQQVRELVRAQLRAAKDPVTEQKRQQLELLMGVRPHAALTKRIQELYRSNGKTGPEPPSGELKVSDSLLTPSQRIQRGYGT